MRAYQFLLITTFLPLCWLLMQAAHELGHVTAAYATGGTVAKVVLHPLAISRTDSLASRHPMAVVWAGPALGICLPLLLWAIAATAGWKYSYLLRFFAGFCLIANGSYLGAGSFQGIGDAGDLVRQGCPRWSLWIFGLLTVPLGIFVWNGLGRKFGLGQAAGQVDRRAAVASAMLLALVAAAECVLSGTN